MCGLTYDVFVVVVEPTLMAGLVPSPLVLSQSTALLVPTLERTWSLILLISKHVFHLMCTGWWANHSFQLDQYLVPLYGREFQTQAEGAWLRGPLPFQWSSIYDLKYHTQSAFG